jgi:hypothetical protein
VIAALCLSYPAVHPLEAIGMRADVAMRLLQGRSRLMEAAHAAASPAPAGAAGAAEPIDGLEQLKAFVRKYS